MNIKLYTDGGFQNGRAAISFIVKEDDNVVYTQSADAPKASTNNEAEYDALYCGLRYIAARYDRNEIHSITHLSDSQLLVSHFNGTFNVSKQELIVRMAAIKTLCLLSLDDKVTCIQIPRKENSDADWLCNLILDMF